MDLVLLDLFLATQVSKPKTLCRLLYDQADCGGQCGVAAPSTGDARLCKDLTGDLNHYTELSTLQLPNCKGRNNAIPMALCYNI
jgi:hypothetical protein